MSCCSPEATRENLGARRDLFLLNLTESLAARLDAPATTADDLLRLASAGEPVRRTVALLEAVPPNVASLLASYEAALAAFRGPTPATLIDDAMAIASEVTTYCTPRAGAKADRAGAVCPSRETASAEHAAARGELEHRGRARARVPGPEQRSLASNLVPGPGSPTASSRSTSHRGRQPSGARIATRTRCSGRRRPVPHDCAAHGLQREVAKLFGVRRFTAICRRAVQQVGERETDEVIRRASMASDDMIDVMSDEGIALKGDRLDFMLRRRQYIDHRRNQLIAFLIGTSADDDREIELRTESTDYRGGADNVQRLVVANGQNSEYVRERERIWP